MPKIWSQFLVMGKARRPVVKKWMTTPDPSLGVSWTSLWAWWCNCAWTKTQISFYELVGLISASNTPLGISGVTSKWKWLFVDCSTLFIFSRYFLIGYVSHEIRTWAEQTCGTKDAYPMRGRTEEILHHGPHQLNSGQDFWQMPNLDGHFWEHVQQVPPCDCMVQGIAHPIMRNMSKPQLCISLCQTRVTSNTCPP
jgi:hypothetical protein